MAFTRADALAAAERSVEAAGAHERSPWLALFTPHGRVEDPVGSRPHRGRAQIGRFYDTFIGPRDIRAHPDVDVVVGTTVIRDLELEVRMGSGLALRIPAYLRYDLREHGGELKIAALLAFWELPSMVLQFLRGGPRAVPAGLQLSVGLLRNQGLAGTLGFLSGLRGAGASGRRQFAKFLDQACAGDELTVRRRLARKARITRGDDDALTAAELLNRMAGARWYKLICSGHTMVASVERSGEYAVLFADVGSNPFTVKRIRYFSELD
ncbi:nuclear transport factor 2 family protein [Mycobacterium hubeiense]|uniref:nuclear transport factor 2 family protein n=1 Tax=Mycobacterium hubeiense TaxID=1867256 RepID=UPI000C7EDD27|nr:nuclear transport factor 2 family protein [Mycobacterium sp. QGD 101]